MTVANPEKFSADDMMRNAEKSAAKAVEHVAHSAENVSTFLKDLTNSLKTSGAEISASIKLTAEKTSKVINEAKLDEKVQKLTQETTEKVDALTKKTVARIEAVARNSTNRIAKNVREGIENSVTVERVKNVIDVPSKRIGKAIEDTYYNVERVVTLKDKHKFDTMHPETIDDNTRNLDLMANAYIKSSGEADFDRVGGLNIFNFRGHEINLNRNENLRQALIARAEEIRRKEKVAAEYTSRREQANSNESIERRIQEGNINFAKQFVKKDIDNSKGELDLAFENPHTASLVEDYINTGTNSQEFIPHSDRESYIDSAKGNLRRRVQQNPALAILTPEQWDAYVKTELTQQYEKNLEGIFEKALQRWVTNNMNGDIPNPPTGISAEKAVRILERYRQQQQARPANKRVVPVRSAANTRPQRRPRS